MEQRKTFLDEWWEEEALNSPLVCDKPTDAIDVEVVTETEEAENADNNDGETKTTFTGELEWNDFVVGGFNPYNPHSENSQEVLFYKKWRLEELKYLKGKEVEELEEAKKKVLEFERANKVLFFGHEGKEYLGKYGKWEPNPGQVEFFNVFRDKAEYIKAWIFAGANRSAKTFTFTGIVPLMVCIGRFPWEDPSVGTWIWDRLGWKPPIKIRVIGQDWTNHVKSVIIPCFQEVFPKVMEFETRKNNQGVDATWKYKENGSLIELLSNYSESDVFEGWSGHIVCYDEPPKRDIRVACVRGLVDNNGIEFFAMTLLKEAWVDKEVINRMDEEGNPDDTVYSINVNIYNNEGYGLNKNGIEQFKKSLNEDEISARIDGVPSYKSGLCLKFQRKIHVIKSFEIPSHWMVDVAIDIGVAKPHDVTYLATSDKNVKYLIRSVQVKGNGTLIADEIVKEMNRSGIRINRVIVDPLAKADKNNENSTYEQIDMHLSRFGLYLEVGSKDKEDGIRRINEYMETVHGTSGFFLLKDASPNGRAVRQIENWMYDEDGKPSKDDDDVCENLYRLFLLNTIYEEMEDIDDHEQKPPVNDTRNKVTGY